MNSLHARLDRIAVVTAMMMMMMMMVKNAVDQVGDCEQDTNGDDDGNGIVDRF